MKNAGYFIHGIEWILEALNNTEQGSIRYQKTRIDLGYTMHTPFPFN